MISLFSKSFLDVILFTYSFYMPIVSVPLLLAIFGFRSTSKAVIIGMIASFVAVIMFNLFSNVDAIMPGMIANLLFFIGSHYLLKESGGWLGIKEREPFDNIRLNRRKKINDFIQSIKNFNFMLFCQNNSPKEEKIYVYFGLFCIVPIFSNVFSLPEIFYKTHNNVLFVIES